MELTNGKRLLLEFQGCDRNFE